MLLLMNFFDPSFILKVYSRFINDPGAKHSSSSSHHFVIILINALLLILRFELFISLFVNLGVFSESFLPILQSVQALTFSLYLQLSFSSLTAISSRFFILPSKFYCYFFDGFLESNFFSFSMTSWLYILLKVLYISL